MASAGAIFPEAMFQTIGIVTSNVMLLCATYTVLVWLLDYSPAACTP